MTPAARRIGLIGLGALISTAFQVATRICLNHSIAYKENP